MKAILLLSLQIAIAHLLFSQQDTLPARVYNLAKFTTAKDSSRDRIQVMDGSTSVLANLEVHLTTLEPGKAAHPPHTHTNQEELIIVKEGLLKVTIKGKTKLLSAGGLAYSFPGDEHGAVNAGKTKTSYYIVKYTTHNAVNTGRGESAGGSILMDWNEPKVEKTDRGERRQFFNQPTALFEKFDMHVTTLNKGNVSHLPHSHRQEEIILVKSGNISMQIGGKHYSATAGDIVFLPTGVLHALENTGNGPATYFAFQWQ
ncbi:MAG: cupin domain-containing protein [Chitinophagaceae bacterium]